MKILPQHLSEKFIGDINPLPISLKEIKIYRLLVSPSAFLKLSIRGIDLVQKGLSCPSLAIGIVNFRFATFASSYMFYYLTRDSNNQFSNSSILSYVLCSLRYIRYYRQQAMNASKSETGVR